MVEAATNKINTLLESFLGINDSELGKQRVSGTVRGCRSAVPGPPCGHIQEYDARGVCAFCHDSG